MADWLKRGYDEADKKEKEIDEKKQSYVNRFWLKPEGTANIVFIDDEPPILEEHQLKINGDWRNWFTCLKIMGKTCSHCDSGDKPATKGFYSIIDTTEWEDGKGNKHKNERKLLGVTLKTLKKLKRASAKQKQKGEDGLVGCMFEVYRTASDAPNTGDDWTFVKRLTSDEMLALMKEGNKDAKLEPFDYEKILAPKSDETMKNALKSGAQEASDEYNSEDDIDF